jgi:hypothetical protein
MEIEEQTLIGMIEDIASLKTDVADIRENHLEAIENEVKGVRRWLMGITASIYLALIVNFCLSYHK